MLHLRCSVLPLGVVSLQLWSAEFNSLMHTSALQGWSICTQNGSHKSTAGQMDHPWRVLVCPSCSGFHVLTDTSSRKLIGRVPVLKYGLVISITPSRSKHIIAQTIWKQHTEATISTKAHITYIDYVATSTSHEKRRANHPLVIGCWSKLGAVMVSWCF